MANVSYYSGAPMEDHSDLGGMWEQALNDYYTEAGVDLRLLEPGRRDMAYIQAEQDRQVLLFSEFRHNKGKVDKLRTLVSQNSAMIMKVASHVADAASAAFPPSAAIMTAFNYVMNASKAVSDDYDMIVSFFEIMNSFLERVSMLEGRMPEMRPFRRFLMNVFSAMMTLTGIARKYRTSKGRLVKWAKALVDGQDPKLKGAFNSLHNHLQQFESATMLATLRTAIDTGKKVDTVDRKMDVTIQLGEQNVAIGQQGLAVGQQGVAIGQQGLVLGQQSLEVGQESYMQILEIKGSSQELLDLVARQDEDRKKFEASFEKKLTRLGTQSRDNAAASGGSTDAGARKSTALKSLASLLDCQINSRRQLEEFDNTFAPGTFAWFKKKQAYAKVRDGETPMLWISGGPGTGKTNLAYMLAKSLQDDLRVDLGHSTSLAYFFFREDSSERSIAHMLKSCAYQIAQQDIKYREELLADLQDKKKDVDGPIQSLDDPVKLMDRLFLDKVSKHSRVPDRRIVLLIDGVDETATSDLDKFAKLLAWYQGEVAAKAKEKASINLTLIFTSDTSFASQPLPGVDPSENVEDVLEKAMRFPLDLTRSGMKKDMKTIALFRMKQLSKLRRLRIEARKKIATKLRAKADSIQYIEHMLRRFNAIGRESPILRELDQLPANTKAVYQLLLDDCQKSRTDQDLVVLRKFFAWMAYAREPLKFISGSKLLHYISREHAISIDEEIEHRSARLLRLAGAATDDAQETDASDTEFDKTADDGHRTGDEDEHDEFSSEDMDVLLGFQERSLRQYFRQQETDGERGIRTAPSVGHLMIVQTMAAMLTENATNLPQLMQQGEKLLIDYTAGHWREHLKEIKRDDLSPEQAASLIESIHGVLSNRNSSLLLMEYYLDWTKPSVFGSDTDDHEDILKVMQDWALHATNLPSHVLSSGTLEWMRPLIRNPKIIYIRAAEAHVSNWFLNPGECWSMEKSFLCAHRALELGKDLLQQHEELRTYFADWTARKYTTIMPDGTDLVNDPDFKENSVLVVAKAFWQMQMTMTAQCYRAIGMAMQSLGLWEPSLKQFALGLENADTDKDRLQIHTPMTTVLLELALQAERDEEQKERDLQECIKTIARGEEWTHEIVPDIAQLEQSPKKDSDEPHEAPNGITDGHTEDNEEKKDSDIAEPDKPEAETSNNILVNEKAQEQLTKERDEFARQKRDYAQRAADLMATVSALDLNLDDMTQTQDDVLKQALIDMHMRHSTAELILGNSDNVVAYLVEARKIPMKRFYLDFDDQVRRLCKREEYDKIMDLVGGSDKTNRMYFLLYSNKATIEAYMRAGKETGKTDAVINAYKETITLLSSSDGIARAVGAMRKLADFYMIVIGGEDGFARAKALLHQVVSVSADPADITGATFTLADILIEEFRRTNDPIVKLRAHTEMKNLARQIRENMGSDFDPSQSQTNIPLALTTRKLAAVEYQQLLEATFKGCVQALSDDVSYNDSVSFRTLAKVLAVVGLKRDAEIAATLQLYIVDMELHRKETSHDDANSKSDSSSDTEVEGAPVTEVNGDDHATEKKPDLPAASEILEVRENGEVAVVNGNAKPEKTEPETNGVAAETNEEPSSPTAPQGSEEEPETKESGETSPSDPTPAPEEGTDLPLPITASYDFNHLTYQQCNSCDAICQGAWGDKVYYLCYYCTERTLCSKCYDDKVAREKGELPPDWHTICPKGHRHVKAPVEDWLGVKDGVLEFKDQQVKFSHWLTELEHKKWPDVWEKFWSEEIQD